MVRRYKEIRDTFPVVPYPKKADYTTIYGYKGGKVLGTFPDKVSASKAGASVVDTSVDTEKFETAMEIYRTNERMIQDAWESDLRAEYSDISKELYDAIFSEAYDRGHSSGWDEVAIYVEEYYDFAMKVIRINKKE